ncbi:MAG: ribonuclease Z [Flavobacteriales bacterium]|nr:ribonuclease Z [Flavobacteriales bacterium]
MYRRTPFTVITLGTGAALPARGRYPTAQLVQIGGASYLVDCGEGTQERLRSEGINFVGIDRIFIGHLHGDHYLGLMGLISSMHLLGRKKELHVHGPKELKEVLDVQLRASGTYLRFPLHVHTVLHNSGVVLFSDKRVTITSLALKHRIPCTGFLFKEVLGPRRLRPDRVESIPIRERVAVKNGADVTLSDGTKIPNVELTFDPYPVRSYAYCSDTAYEPALIPFLLGVDLLYHEATFTNAMVAKAKETMHSTAGQAAEIAKSARVSHLLIGHFSSRFKSVDGLLEEARAIFPNTDLSYEGGRFLVGEG